MMGVNLQKNGSRIIFVAMLKPPNTPRRERAGLTRAVGRAVSVEEDHASTIRLRELDPKKELASFRVVYARSRRINLHTIRFSLSTSSNIAVRNCSYQLSIPALCLRYVLPKRRQTARKVLQPSYSAFGKRCQR